MTIYSNGRDFIYREARPLEQRLFEALFEGANRQGVFDALRAYRNEDGGFGHGLEPDKRCPASQPLDVQVALQTYDRAGGIDPEMAQRACDFLDTVGDERGAVAPVLPSIADYPRAAHWGDGNFPPGLNPTAGIAGLLHRFGVEHPWLERATAYCWEELEREIPPEAHTLIAVCDFLAHVPDRARARKLIAAVREQLPRSQFFLSDPDAQGYGLTPLQFAPTPQSPWRDLFSDRNIEGHLDRLQADQQEDGGWPVLWEPPSTASTLEWRGMLTLQALRTLTSYGRIAPSP